jgi:hypothetical protein
MESKNLMERKKSIDLTGLNPGLLSKLKSNSEYRSSGASRGVANTKLVEPVPFFTQAESEKIIANENNSWIVLGRDRPASRMSGYGGLGDTQAGSIDLVVGRMGANPREVDSNQNKVFVDPNFSIDSARIYMSQKTDIDKNFNLVPGSVGNAIARSAIAVKADHVRIIGREGIKLITKTENKNSRGGDIASVSGIDLIAGNDDRNLQPLVRGKNLVEALERITAHLKGLTGIVETILTSQMKLTTVLAAHTHLTLVGPSLPSIEIAAASIITLIEQTIQSLISLPLHRTNVEMMKFNYLQPFGGKYINSRFNNTN